MHAWVVGLSAIARTSEQGADAGCAASNAGGVSSAGRRGAGPSSGGGWACSAGNSFVAGTAVLMADGTLEDIEDVELGDLVWARDPETGEVGARPVSALIEGSGLKELVDVEVDGETITATHEHPFWVDDEGRWVDAEDLQVDDLLLLADGTTTEVDGVWHHTQTLTVHNLTVEGIHTYHVALGDQEALVHNDICRGTFEVRAGELAQSSNVQFRHPINDLQLHGGEEVGHGGVSNLSNDDLLTPGGPAGDDPISGHRSWAPDDDDVGSIISVEAGHHHRVWEIGRRVQEGLLDPDAIVVFVRSGG